MRRGNAVRRRLKLNIDGAGGKRARHELGDRN